MLICGQRRQQQPSSGTWGEGGRGGEIKEKMVMIVDMVRTIVFAAKEEEIFTLLEVRIGCTHNCSFGFIVFRLPFLIFVNIIQCDSHPGSGSSSN